MGFRKRKDGEYHRNKKIIVRSNYGKKANVWKYKIGGATATDKIAFKHPAIFPENLARDHIYSWSNEGDVVLDPFNGSGTTTKMAYLMKRKYVGIDISEEILNEARRSLNDLPFSVEFFQADITQELPSSIKEEFDMVFAIASICHIPSEELRDNVFKKINSLLSSNGIFIMTNWGC